MVNKKLTLSSIARAFYKRYDGVNQYYIDRANFQVFNNFRHNPLNLNSYDKVLIKLNKKGLLLGRIKECDRNKKMCEIALNQNIKCIKFIPSVILLKIYNDLVNSSYCMFLPNIILEECELRKEMGVLKANDGYNKNNNKRINKELGKDIFYCDSNGEKNDFDTYYKDRDEFKIINSFFLNNPLNGLFYDEVLLNLSFNGLLLKYIKRKNRNKKMYEIAVKQNPKAIKFAT